MNIGIARFAVSAGLSATAFWMPDVILFGLWPKSSAGAPHWDAIGVPLITVLCPAALAAFIWLRRKRANASRWERSVAAPALLGIWLLAPYFTLMALALRPATAGDDSISLLFSVVVRHPAAAYMMVIVQGGTYALIIATLMLVCVYLYWERPSRRELPSNAIR